MKRLTGMTQDQEWALADLFYEIRRAEDRRQRLQFEGLTWVPSTHESSDYIQLIEGPVAVLGLAGIDYLYVDHFGHFVNVRFYPTVGRCLVGDNPSPQTLTRVYADDAGPWWEILARATPVWHARMMDALVQAEEASGRGLELQRAATACRAYLKREGA